MGVNAMQAEGFNLKKATQEKRVNSRLTYSSSCSPAVIVKGRMHPLIDISIKAVKFVTAPDNRLDFPLGRFFIARIIFQDGELQDIQGYITRINAGEAVLQLQHAISSARIFKERRYLIENSHGGN